MTDDNFNWWVMGLRGGTTDRVIARMMEGWLGH